jgi:hypothetical protein
MTIRLSQWLCAGIAPLAFAVPLSAAVFYVSPTGGAVPPYTTVETAARRIQDAVDISGGDTITILPGVYEEYVNVHQPVSILGSGADVTVILPGLEVSDGDVQGTLTFTSYARLSGLTVLSGELPALWVLDGNVTVSDCVLSTSLSYAVVRVGDADLHMQGCTIVAGQHNGVDAYGDGSLEMLNCVVSNNKECGVYLGGTSAFLSECLITDNRSGIVCGRGTATVHSCRVIKNTWSGIGIDSGKMYVLDCLIARNGSVGISAAGIEPVFVDHCTIVLNGRGIGGIDFEVSNSIIWGNWDDFDSLAETVQWLQRVRRSLVGQERFAGINDNITDHPGFLGWWMPDRPDGVLHVDPSAPEGGDGSSNRPYRSVAEMAALYDLRLAPNSPCVGAGHGGSNLGALPVAPSPAQAGSQEVLVLLAPGTYEEPSLYLPPGTTLEPQGSQRPLIRGAFGPWPTCAIVSLPRGAIRRTDMQDLLLMPRGTEITDCSFTGTVLRCATSRVSRCRFERGGVNCHYDPGRTTVDNCLFWRRELAGSAVNGNDWTQVISCTIYGYGTAINRAERVVNCVLWGNERQMYIPSDVSYSDVEGGYPGEGNMHADPMFANAGGGDFRLLPDSPCIDVGFNDPDLPETDIAGMHRIMFGGKSLTVDMGAYEFYINDLSPGPEPDEATFTWSSLADRTYSIFYTDDLLTWHLILENFPSSGNTTTSWTDDGSLTGLPPSLAPKRFYRLLENE